MNKPVAKSRPLELRRLRSEAEDLLDLLDGLEARARNLGKSTHSLEDARKKLGLAK